MGKVYFGKLVPRVECRRGILTHWKVSHIGFPPSVLVIQVTLL